ncbi:Serine/threonine protein kinase [Hyalangium minutum]|uniref:Serine/threonine protein kinase n=1 Tax=Hyalangium minutum TaxID=394096 RepID=A0A085WMQ0_9BACT|nr:Serine/threonine protein kinase [Hyalangium minutum]
MLIKKVLPEHASNPDFTTMFIREARISSSLSHSNIAQVYDFGCIDGEYFLAMEYVDGQPLNRVLQRALRSGLSSIPAPLALLIGSEMCRGLHYAHTRLDQQGQPLEIVHRDIAPDNVLISYEGQVKIVDFGIAQSSEPRDFATTPGTVKGKFLYFSPEQARGELVDARTDVWATGVVLYKLLCGRLPVEGPAYSALSRIVRGEFPRPCVINPELPLELDAIVMRALTLRREDRYPSCMALDEALTEALASMDPRLSTRSLSSFIHALFSEDLRAEGRQPLVPPSFQEQLDRWRTGTSPQLPASPQRAPSVEPPTDTQVEPVRPLSSRMRLLGVGVGSAVAGAALALAMATPRSPTPQPMPRVAGESGLTRKEPRAPASGGASAVIPVAVASMVVAAPSASPPGAPAAESPRPVPSEPPAAYASAEKALLRNNVKLAAFQGEKCIQQDPQWAECFLIAGEAYTRQRSDSLSRKAADRYTRFLRLAPTHPRALEIRQKLRRLEARRAFVEGTQLFKVRQFDEALPRAQQCLQQAPDDAHCQLLAGDAALALGQQARASEHYRKFLELAPDHAAAPRVRATLANDELRRAHRK